MDLDLAQAILNDIRTAHWRLLFQYDQSLRFHTEFLFRQCEFFLLTLSVILQAIMFFLAHHHVLLLQLGTRFMSLILVVEVNLLKVLAFPLIRCCRYRN